MLKKLAYITTGLSVVGIALYLIIAQATGAGYSDQYLIPMIVIGFVVLGAVKVMMGLDRLTGGR